MDAHAVVLTRLALPGDWWTGAERVAIAATARAALIDAVGGDGFVDAAGVVGHFERLVRVADATGIPLDAAAAEATVDIREDLDLNTFGMAARTLGQNP